MLTETEGRRTKQFETGESGVLTCLVFNSGDDVDGTCEVQPSGRIEHGGITAELVGVLEQYHDRGNVREFTKATQVLAGPGKLLDVTKYHFSFAAANLPHETFYGVNVRVRYFVRVVVAGKAGAGSVSEKAVEFAVEQQGVRPTADTKIKMEVGIEDFLHIEFEYDREHYALHDVLTGRVFFRLVQLRLKHMELAIIRREKTRTRGFAYAESDTLCKYEVMDGVPARGTVVPLRLFLEAYDLTPTYRKIEGVFSVEYFVNLVLIDQDDRRYFKQHEIVLFREAPGTKRKVAASIVSGASTPTAHPPAASTESATHRPAPISAASAAPAPARAPAPAPAPAKRPAAAAPAPAAAAAAAGSSGGGFRSRPSQPANAALDSDGGSDDGL